MKRKIILLPQTFEEKILLNKSLSRIMSIKNLDQKAAKVEINAMLAGQKTSKEIINFLKVWNDCYDRVVFGGFLEECKSNKGNIFDTCNKFDLR